MSDEEREQINLLILENESLRAKLDQTEARLTLEHQHNLMLQEELASLRTLGTDFQ